MQQHGVAIVVGIQSRSGGAVATIVIGEELAGPTESCVVRKVGDFGQHLRIQNRKLRGRS
jgi:hypothetical protein